MSENVSEPLNNVELPQQIMATDQTMASTSSCNVTNSAMDSPQTTAEPMNDIRTDNIAEEITTTVESMSNNETISVSTQVNIISSHQGETSEYTSQALLHAATMTDKNIVQDSESVSLPANTIAMSAEGAIVNNSQGDLIEILPVTLPALSTLPPLNPNLPPWAARLRDCELIGDSYRGYVTNEVELDLILTLHKQHTNSCWGTRQSPSSAKPSIRLMWKSQYVPYDGIPFLNTGRRATVMECQYGPRRKGSNTKKTREYDNQGNALKKGHRPTCPARIYIKKVKKFPEYRIDVDLNLEGKNVRQAQERALAHLRLAGVESGGEERFYVQLPLPLAHEYHDIEDMSMAQSPDSRGQRLDQQVADKIYELVARGITGVYTIKHCLKEFVEKEMYLGQEAPPRHNKAFFPTIIDLQNHIHEAQSALESGQLLPLPPLNNPPIGPSPTKERTRKRKQPTKHSQTSQTINRLQTDEAIASIQQLDDDSSSEGRDEKTEKNQHLQEQLAQYNESTSHPLVITHGQTDPAKNGQVVIVVTSNNVFTAGQENDTPTSFAQISLPSSHITNIPSTSFGTLPTGSQAVLIAHQQGENGQYQLAQQNNLLTVVNPALQGINPNQRVVLRMVPNSGNLPAPTAIESQSDQSSPEHLLANQVALAAVLNVATHVQKTPDNKQEQRINDGEPPLKRQAVSIDLSSLVKEAGFDGTNVQISGMSTEDNATSNSTMLASSDNTSYTDHTTGAVEYSYHSNGNDCKQSNQDLHPHQDINSSQEEQSVLDSVADFQVLHDDAGQSTDHDTVDTSQIHPITMETSELINSFPKFSSASTSPVIHVSSDVTMMSSAHTTSNNDIVLVSDAQDPNSYQSADTQNTSDEDLTAKQLSNV